MSLHDEIMNLPSGQGTMSQSPDMAYKIGHRDARHAAAELALKADAEIERLRAALAFMVANIGQPVALETREGFANARALLGEQA